MPTDPSSLDAMLRAARGGVAGRPLGRRNLFRGAGLAALALGAPGLLSACGTDSQVQSAEGCKSTDISDEEKEVVFSNWPEYIDRKGQAIPTLEGFETKSGIQVTYNTDINDNNDFFGKVKDQLGSCEPIGRDIITLTDWMAARMIGLGWIQKLDKSAMPNVEANLAADLTSPSWDSEREYSVPWQSGLTGIAYNAKYTGEVRSF
jgi:spermidine/putrescine transport system substrate-binding protein